ncbi:MAG: hypothetical protein QM775_34950 [Pirellulales bacterium]
MPPTAKQLEQQLAKLKAAGAEPRTDLQRRCIRAVEISLAITREMESRIPPEPQGREPQSPPTMPPTMLQTRAMATAVSC